MVFLASSLPLTSTPSLAAAKPSMLANPTACIFSVNTTSSSSNWFQVNQSHSQTTRLTIVFASARRSASFWRSRSMFPTRGTPLGLIGQFQCDDFPGDLEELSSYPCVTEENIRCGAHPLELNLPKSR